MAGPRNTLRRTPMAVLFCSAAGSPAASRLGSTTATIVGVVGALALLLLFIVVGFVATQVYRRGPRSGKPC
jgi:hypothetical protein